MKLNKLNYAKILLLTAIFLFLGAWLGFKVAKPWVDLYNWKGAPLEDDLSIAIKLNKKHIWKPRIDSYFKSKNFRTLDGVFDTSVVFLNKECLQYMFDHGYNPCERRVSSLTFQDYDEQVKTLVLDEMRKKGCY